MNTIGKIENIDANPSEEILSRISKGYGEASQGNPYDAMHGVNISKLVSDKGDVDADISKPFKQLEKKLSGTLASNPGSIPGRNVGRNGSMRKLYKGSTIEHLPI